MPSEDFFDIYSRDKKADAAPSVEKSNIPSIFTYDRPEVEIVKEKGKPEKVVISSPRGDVLNASGFNNRMVSGMPIVGPLFDKATAAVGATIQPLFVKPKNLSDLVTGEDRPGSQSDWSGRYRANLLMQDQRNETYAADHPGAAIAADVVGSGLVLGPASETALGARLMGLRGNSLGAKVYQGAAGMGAVETANQLLKGNNPIEQGVVGPVPLAMVGGAAGPMIGEGISKAGSAIVDWLPRKSGSLAGVNSTGRNLLTGALDGETQASLAEAQRLYGRSGMLADVNNATTDLAGGLADIPGPHKQVIREAYRARAAGQADRIEQSLNKNTVPDVNVAKLSRSIEEARAADADPLYQQFRTMPIQPTNEIKALIPRLEAAGAFNKAEELSGISGKPIDRKFFTGGPQKEYPTAETWDYVKRGLDRRIGEALDKTKPDKDLARELINLKNQTLAEIDKTPAGKVYQQAREAYAEPSELLHQMQEGKKSFSRATDKEELAHELNGLSGPELSARVQGARKAIQEVLESSVRGDTTARNMLLSRSNKDKLEMLFGQKRADQLVADLEAEVRGKGKVENVIGGSQTTPKKERISAMTPAPSEMGYISNLNVTKPASFVPDWMKPQTIMEGSKAARYATAYQQIAPLLTTNMGDPAFKTLVADIMKDRTVGEGLRNRLMQAGNAASALVQIAGSPARNRLYVGPRRD